MSSITKRFVILTMALLAFVKLPCFAAEEPLPPQAERGPFSVLVGDEPNLVEGTCPEDLRETGLRLLARVHRTDDYSKARLWLDQVQEILGQCRALRAERRHEGTIKISFIRLADALEQSLLSACPTSVVEQLLPVIEEVRKTDTANSWLRARSEINPVIEGCREASRKRAARELEAKLAAEEEKRRREAERRAEEQRSKRVQEFERATARLAELEAAREELEVKLAAELERQARLKEYCDNGHLYFTKTLFGFGDWAEIDESTGITVPIKEFDLNNAVRNRLLELEAAGWKGKIPAKTVACGPGVQAIHEVLR